MNRKMSPHETRKLWMGRVVIWVTIIIVLFPVLWIVMSSFSAGDSFFLSSLFPKKFSIEHYTSLFQETNFMLWTWNSVKLCLIVAAIQLAMTSLAAYAFSRLRFTGRKYGLMSLLVLQVFPSSMKSYMDGLPKELDEAAMVDGATHFQVFRKIILPLAAPQLAVIFLFSFIATYSEYVITSIFLQTPGKMTLALGLQTFISDQFAAHWTTFSAAAVLSSIPIMIVFMCLQKYIQSGLVSGGVKG